MNVRPKIDEEVARLKLDTQTVRKTKKQLLTEGYQPNVLLIDDSSAPWSTQGFQPPDLQDREHDPRFMGTLEGLSVFWNPIIAKDKAVVLDRQRMIQIEVFKELEEGSVIITAHYREGDKERGNANELSNEEKVLVEASELVRITLLDIKAGKVVPID